MLTRAAVEAILWRRFRDGSGIRIAEDYLKMVADDLLALAPTLSREALRRILDSADFDMTGIEQLMAWATGTPTREWCGHWQWNGTAWVRVGGMFNGAEGYQDAKFCDQCAAPRPETP